MLRHSLIVLLALISTASILPGKPVRQVGPEPELLYFPMTVGTEWEYIDDGSKPKYVITNVERAGEASLVTVGTYQSNGKTTQHAYTVEVSRTGIRETLNFHRKIEPPAPWLKLPRAKGDRWESPFSIDGDRRADYVMTVLGVEEVTVPAGTFKAIRVEQVSTDFVTKTVNQTITTWYAPGVGPVRIIYRGGSSRDLVAFKRGDGVAPRK
jgi:hypothetical protein